MAGFYASLGPTLIRSFAGTTSILLGGFALFVLAGSGALAVYLIREASPRALMRLGALALIAGMAFVMIAIGHHSVPLFLLGSAVAGLGFGTGFQGALRSVVLLIAPQERAGVLSVLFVIAYLAMGLPAMVAGYDVAHQGNIVVTAYEFGSGVVLLALLALLGTARR
jgi:hypothetical protein